MQMKVILSLLSTILMYSCVSEIESGDYVETPLSSSEIEVINRVKSDGTIHFFGTDVFLHQIDSLHNYYGMQSVEMDSLMVMDIIEYGKEYLMKNGFTHDEIDSIGDYDAGMISILMSGVELLSLKDGNSTNLITEERLTYCLLNEILYDGAINLIKKIFYRRYSPSMTNSEVKVLLITIAKEMKISDKMINKVVGRYIPGFGYIYTIYNIVECLLGETSSATK